jgi:Holliday junction DNA helicase RuvB
LYNTLTDRVAPVLESHDYPRRWADYVGQEQAKRMLQVAAKSARVRKQPLDHVLIAHPSPGIGKTALAVLIASEMRRPVRVVSGAMDSNMARLVFDTMSDGDLLLYDEAHKMMDGGKKQAEFWLTYLQDGYISGPLGPEDQPRVTVVAATTDPQKLPETIASRFPLKPPMRDYTTEEAAKIAIKMSRTVLEGCPTLGNKDALAIAAAGHNNPRAIRAMLVVLRDLTITGELEPVKGRYDVPRLLEFQGITHDGLDLVAQQYLATLATEFAGTAGAKALEDRLQQPGGLAIVERVLMDRGLVAKTRTGRTLTQAGIRRYRELQEAS